VLRVKTSAVSGIATRTAAKRLWPTFYGSILIVVIILMPYGVAGFLHRLGRLTLSDAGATLRGIPDGLSRRARKAKEDLSWAWETRPFKRESRNKD